MVLLGREASGGFARDRAVVSRRGTMYGVAGWLLRAVLLLLLLTTCFLAVVVVADYYCCLLLLTTFGKQEGSSSIRIQEYASCYY
jgi:hypothetical protein